MKAEGKNIRMNKVLLYNVIGMLIVTCIDEYYRSSSMNLCVFYTKQRKLIKIWDGKKSIAKELLCQHCQMFFFVLFICIFLLFSKNNVNVLHAYRGQTI